MDEAAVEGSFEGSRRLAQDREHGVCCVVAGHIHEMLHMEFEGVSYVSLPSAGGHLRLSGRYEDGWFFGYTLVEVRGADIRFDIKEIEGRVTGLGDWGNLGLAKAARAQ